MGLLAAYAIAAIYTYMESPQPEQDEDEILLPQMCYPENLSGGCCGPCVQLSMKGPPLLTRRDIEEIKLILLLILREVKKPKNDDLITLLKALIVDLLSDPSVAIIFPYVSINAFLEQLIGHQFSISECPFSGMIEIPPFDTTSAEDDKAGDGNDEVNCPHIEWGGNMWPEDAQKLGMSNLSLTKVSINRVTTDCAFKCLYYEIRDKSPPIRVRKRAQILMSEGAMLDQVTRAKGEAGAILARSQATAEGSEWSLSP